MKFSVTPKRLFGALVTCIVVLTLMSLTVLLAGHFTGHGRLMGIGPLFSENTEMNVPTWYSSIALMLCSVLLWFIASAKAGTGEQYAGHWKFLSIAFAVASADEITSTHGMLGDAMQRSFKSGFLSQVEPTAVMGLIALILAVVNARFLLNLPRRTRNLFLLAGVLFVGGSVGMEFVWGIWRTYFGEGRLAYIIVVTLEEGAGEMMGVAVFAYALSAYITQHMSGLEIRFNDDATEPSLRAQPESLH